MGTRTEFFETLKFHYLSANKTQILKHLFDIFSTSLFHSSWVIEVPTFFNQTNSEISNEIVVEVLYCSSCCGCCNSAEMKEEMEICQAVLVTEYYLVLVRTSTSTAKINLK